jgi:hypothetical protein
MSAAIELLRIHPVAIIGGVLIQKDDSDFYQSLAQPSSGNMPIESSYRPPASANAWP